MKRLYLFLLLAVSIFLLSGCDGVECGLENCHGIDFSCGWDVAKDCTEEFAPGDECRELVECKILDGRCEMVKKSGFEMCVWSVDPTYKFASGEDPAETTANAVKEKSSEPKQKIVEAADQEQEVPEGQDEEPQTSPGETGDENNDVDDGSCNEPVNGTGNETGDMTDGGVNNGLCAGLGQEYSPEGGEYQIECCSGLIGWLFGTDNRISLGGECYETNMETGDPVGLCIACGDGTCDGIEDVCNCPEDCDERSVYTLAQFCNNPDWQLECGRRGSMRGQLPCTLC
ncbi:MAG: hypothetical protein ABIE94_03140 [archaeon]